MIIYLVYAAAIMLAVIFLLQMGGVFPILTAIILMLGLFVIGGAVFNGLMEYAVKKEKEEETNGSAGDIQ